jgi:hypothetical protein
MNLRLLLPLLQLVASSGGRKAALRRVAGATAGLFAALVLLLSAFGFGLSAGYGYLATLLPPPTAAAAMAAILLLAATLIVAVPSVLQRRRRAKARAAGAEAPFAAIFTQLSAWGRANPWEAAAAAFVVGLTLGKRR